MSGMTRRVSLLFLSGTVASCAGDPVSQPVHDEEQRTASSESAIGALNSQDQHGSRHVSILDDCDPNDPAWNATGGCILRGGAVTEAEFGILLASPLSAAVIGHPAWRNEPSYVRVSAGTSVTVTNEGGRLHTFTPVADYGGGRVPPLNIGLTAAPECAPMAADPYQVPPGEKLQLNDLAAGNHRFQCCIHPWMRALIKVE
jgi:plastocyanin